MARHGIILIVDDEKNTRDGLRDALEDHYEVYVAADIAGAMATIESDPPNVLITDLRLLCLDSPNRRSVS
ncbi:MAG: response regulator [Chthoniobacterales bacterium]